MILVYTSVHQCSLGTEMFWLCKQLYINFLLSFSKTICNSETDDTLLKKPDICLHSTWKRLDMADIRAYQLPDISARGILSRDISAWTIHQEDFSAKVLFGSMDVPTHGHFVSVDISAQGLFNAGTLRHGDFLARRHFLASWMFWQGDIMALGHFGTGIFWHM